MYEGIFHKDNYENNGKLVEENGEYFIGHFTNGLKQGSGKCY